MGNRPCLCANGGAFGFPQGRTSPVEVKFDPVTADWTYIRWLGDRKSIEEQTTTSDKTVVDRTSELSSWVDFCYQMRKRGVIVFAYRSVARSR